MNRDKIKNVSSDFELLSLLDEAAGELLAGIPDFTLGKKKQKPSKKDDQDKQHKTNTPKSKNAFQLTEKEEEVPVEEQPEEVPEEVPTEEAEAQPEASANIVLSPDGELAAQTATADVSVAQDKTVQIAVRESYSDAYLLRLLEENGFDTSYSNLVTLKEGLAKGTIVLEDDSKAEPAEEDAPVEEPATEEAPAEEQVPEEAQAEGQPCEGGECAPRVQISMPVDGSMTIENQGKQVQSDAQGNLVVALAETKAMGKTNKFLESYLTEDCGMDHDEYEALLEDTKSDSIKEIANQLLLAVEEKLSGIDTSIADRSRGDIKQLRELPTIQDSLTRLESLLERSDSPKTEYSIAVNTVIKSILYINQYSAAFKDAYRNKKTVMIMRYQSLILAIISSLSYIVAALVESKNGMISLKDSEAELLEYSPLKSLSKFAKSVESGEFKKIVGDVDVLRENFLEVPVEKMSLVLEATEYLPMIVDGIRNMYNNLASDGKVVGLLYKAVGVLVTLFSLRDAFYSLFRMKTKVADMINQLQVFASSGSGSGNSLNKLSQFASKFMADAESGSDLAKRDIEAEDRKIASSVRKIQASALEPSSEPVVAKSKEAPAPATSESIFGFDF